MKILYSPHAYSQQRQREKKAKIYPVLLAMEATKRRNDGNEVFWDSKCCPDRVITEPEGLPFLTLPAPDRKLTKAFGYQENGNYKYHLGTYIQSASGCWWGQCSFCVEKGKAYEVRPIKSVVEELQEIKYLGFKEVFDDSATFPIGKWLDEFCLKAPKGLVYGCNMRMVGVDYKMMKQAGFRMVLFGLESANQHTLDWVNKGTTTDDIRHIIDASKAGLDCHIAVIFGYPWETDEHVLKTLKLVHWLLKKGYANTAQASFYTPPVGISNESQRRFVKKIYDVKYSPEFWFNQLRTIKDKDDIKYLWVKIKKGLGWLS